MSNVDAQVNYQTDQGETLGTEAFSLDPYAGYTYRDKPIWTVEQIAQQIDRSGFSWETSSGDTITYGFYDTAAHVAAYYPTSDGFDESTAFTPFSAAQQALAANSIGLWDDLVDVKFVKSSYAAANIDFGNTSAAINANVQAYTYYPFGATYGPQYSQVAGDVWVGGNLANNFFPLTDGFYATTTLIHEIGHALGLAHPGDYNADQNTPLSYDLADYAQDSRQYSIMSYWDAYETGAQHINFNIMSFGYAATPLVHDIAAVQAIYGADPTTRVGDTTYGFHSTAGRSAFDLTTNVSPVFCIYDAGGKDTLDLSGYNTDSFISLTPGSFSSAGGADHLLTLSEINANRAAIGLGARSQATYDAYVQLAHDLGLTDYLFHDNISIAYNTVIENAVGGGGNDILVANDAANVLTGGGGFDYASYQDATAGVIASLATGGSGGQAAGDSYVGIEGLIGSEFNDTLSGSTGNDTFQGLGGADSFDGGAGTDTVSYVQAFEAVTVSLLGGGTGDAAGDSFVSIENLVGSDYDDTLGGNALVNVIDGGAGVDTLFYGATNAVSLNLATGGTGGLAAGDSYLHIENVHGSNLVDTITGDANDNVIEGGASGDTLDGAGGIDTVSYASSVAAVTINLTNNYTSGGDAARDKISNFENIQGSANGDTLTGNAGDNVIHGGGGNDTIGGSTGNDTLYGDGGADAIRGGNGNDVLYGGDGNDTLNGEGNNDTIFGGAGDDTLAGGDGIDVLDGEAGSNTLSGGSGVDRFVFSVLDGGKDTITDFRTGIDKIDLHLLDAISSTPGHDAFTFIGNAAFSAAGQLHTFLDGGVFSLGGDVDGDGVADLVIALSGVTSIASSDILFA